MGFIKDFIGKEPNNVTPEDIEKFIKEKIEENLNLDYKDIEAISKPDELAKDVSAFANSAGGLIVLGVSEEKTNAEHGKIIKIFPKEITWGDISLSKEQLEHNLRGKIQPKIEGLTIVPIRKSESDPKVIFLIDIPQSLNPPHMALAYHRYYDRLNFEVVPMEHFRVSDLFGKRKKPVLYLRVQITKVNIQDSEHRFTLRFVLENKGKAIAKYPRVVISFSNLEIINTTKNMERIDELQNDIPTVQFGPSISDLIYPISGGVRITDATVKIKDSNLPIIVGYETIAEDADLVKDEYGFSIDTLQKAKAMLERGETVILLNKN